MTHYKDWLWESPVGCVIRRFLQAFAAPLAFFACLWIVYQIETRFFPVVSKWTLDYIERRGNYFVMGGKLYKERSCELINTVVVAVPKSPLYPRVMVYQVGPHEMLGANVPVGFHTWGPWEVRIPNTLIQYKDHVEFIEVVGIHKCHALWKQETVYGSVHIRRVPL